MQAGVLIMEKEFSGKAVIVTGGASGMGLLAGQNFFDRGANVLFCDCNESGLKKVRALFKEDEKRVFTVLCDVRNFNEVQETVRLCLEKFGSLDIMVNCAGGNSCRIFGRREEFCDLPIEQIKWGIDVNLMGTVYFCHEAMRQMREQRSGSIINFGSITGLEGDICGMDYAISKSAIMNGLNKSLAKEGARYGVRVNCVAPGPVLTRPGMASMKTALGRAADPQEIVDMVLYLASERSSFVTGAAILMDGGRHLLMEDGV